MHAPDRDRFVAALEGLARILPPKEPLSEAMVEAYWNALRDLPIEVVEGAILSHQRFRKSFPKPFELRPKDEPESAAATIGNRIRDHWRSAICNEAANVFGYRRDLVKFGELLVAHKDTLATQLLHLLNDVEQQDRRDGRTAGLDRFVLRRCAEIARANQHLRTAHAPQLPAPAAEEAGELAF